MLFGCLKKTSLIVERNDNFIDTKSLEDGEIVYLIEVFVTSPIKLFQKLSHIKLKI